MPENEASPDPAAPASESPSGSNEIRKPRVWPGVLAVLLMWSALTIPSAIWPESPRGFQPLFMGLMASYALAIAWWLFASRTPWRDRVLGFAIFAVGTITGLMFWFHQTLQGGNGFLPLMFFIGPYVITALVIILLLTGRLGWKYARWASLAVVGGGLAVAGMVRYEGVDSAFNAKFLPRWQSNTEERLVASLKPNIAPESVDAAQQAGEGDWPGFRGPMRDGHVLGGSLVADWQTRQPQELWRRPVGPGWSSFCVVGELAVTQEQRGANEAVVAYNALTGEPVWDTTNEARFEESVAGPGPRATPTFFQGSLYTTGADGVIQRLDASNGQVQWRRYLVSDEAADRQGDTQNENPPQWGFASSPLLVTLDTGQSLAIVYAGNPKPEPDAPSLNEAVIAYDAETGEVVWKSGVGYHGYSSPHLATLGGVEQVLVSSNLGLESFDPATGNRLWFFDWDITDFPRSTQPLVVDDSTVILSAGYDSGTQVIDVTNGPEGWSAVERWQQPSRFLEPYFNDSVLHEGHLYGIHKKFLVSVNLETGEQTWPRKVKRQSRLGNGQLVLDPDAGMLLVTAEKTGEVVLVEANPETLVIRGRLQALEPNTNWNHPVVAGGRLYVRNGVEAACFKLPRPIVASR
ncbi:MAG: PQQ-binding-like beta-propeller repeat protein [Planctomycetota bacterium]